MPKARGRDRPASAAGNPGVSRAGVDGWATAELTPAIVVRKGNPKNIRGLRDLARPDVEVSLAVALVAVAMAGGALAVVHWLVLGRKWTRGSRRNSLIGNRHPSACV